MYCYYSCHANYKTKAQRGCVMAHVHTPRKWKNWDSTSLRPEPMMYAVLNR